MGDNSYGRRNRAVTLLLSFYVVVRLIGGLGVSNVEGWENIGWINISGTFILTSLLHLHYSIWVSTRHALQEQNSVLQQTSIIVVKIMV